jgi:hypothetical protein
MLAFNGTIASRRKRSSSPATGYLQPRRTAALRPQTRPTTNVFMAYAFGRI